MRAEQFVVDLISDYLQCEVKPVGGVKDGGIDGYIIRGDEIHSIIQVKWREDKDKAEGVKVVREVGGTLLARGIPNGILVSTRDHYSKPAKKEAEIISTRELSGIGKMNLTLLDYHNILDMLEISNTKLTERMSVEDWFQIPKGVNVFDGAMILDKEFVEQFS